MLPSSDFFFGLCGFWIGQPVLIWTTDLWSGQLAWWFFCWRGSWTAWRSPLGGDGVDGHHYW